MAGLHTVREGALPLYKWEMRTMEWARARLLPLGYAVVAVCALSLRLVNFGFHSADYDNFLLPWFLELREGGGLRALGLSIGNYNVPYLLILALLTYLRVEPLYSIKAVSVLFDMLLAVAAARFMLALLREGERRRAKAAAFLAFSAVLLLPTVFLNSAYWAQCDSIYTAFLLFSLTKLVREQYTAAFVLFSAALTFKLQALFFLPVLLLLYLSRRRFSVLQLLWIPAVFVLSSLPALLAGRGVKDTLTIYFEQMREYPRLAMGYPNIYYILRGEYRLFADAGVAAVVCVFAVFAVWLLYAGHPVRRETLPLLTLWCVLVCVMFLPAMHERYAYFADVLSVLCLLAGCCKWYVPLAINLCSLLSYTRFLFRYAVLEPTFCAFAMLAVLAVVTVNLCGKLTEKRSHFAQNFT